jgi:hypothetical protein
MNENNLKRKRAAPFKWLCFIVMLFAAGAFAWGGRGGSGYHHGYNGYRGHGGFYHGYYGGYGCEFWPYGAADFNVIDPPIGAVFGYVPNGSSLIVVDGIAYYYYNGYYLRPCPAGYLVVSPPEVSPPEVSPPPAPTPAAEPSVAPAPKPPSDGAITINVPNAKGGFTSVKLVKCKDGYKGPQGEFYQGHPTVEELRALYGG